MKHLEMHTLTKTYRVVIKYHDTGSFYNRQYFQVRTVLSDGTLHNVEEKLARSPLETFEKIFTANQIISDKCSSDNIMAVSISISCNNGTELQEFKISIHLSICA
jgi:hypothetical protein